MEPMKPMKTKLQNQSGGRILDVATGHGQFLRLLIDSFADFTEAVGIDVSEKNIEAAQKECDDGMILKVMDAESIDYPDGYFDTVSIQHSLHHLANIDTVLTEMMRVLKPNGLFIIGEVFQSSDNEMENSQRHLHHWWAEVDRAYGGSHNESFTKPEIFKITDKLNLNDSVIFEHLEEFGHIKNKDILDHMLGKCEENIAKLKDTNGPEELIRKGEDLIANFSKSGFTNETALYILGRKAK